MRYLGVLWALTFLGCNTHPTQGTDVGNDPKSDMPTVPDVSRGEADLPLVAPLFEERRVPGRWYGGDFHVHATGASNDAGAESTPERIKEVAIERGLDFVVLTDHSNSTGSDTTTRDEDPTLFNMGPEFPYWDKAAELSDASFLMIDGNEISPVDDPAVDPTGHIGCYPRELANFNPDIAFRDRPRGEVPSSEIIPQARAAGCFVTVNHPFVASWWMAFDWTTRDYDALEVFNGGAGWDKFDYEGVLGWACDVSLGRRVTALGGSDCHRVDTPEPGTLGDPPLGWPTTYVWSGTLEWPGLVRSLDRGRVSVSDTGIPLDLDAYDASRRWLGFQGDDVYAAQVAWMRIRGGLRNSEGESRQLRLLRVAKGDCNDTREPFVIRAPEPNLEVLFEMEIAPDIDFDEAVEVRLQPGDAVFAWLHPAKPDVIGLHGAALSNAIRLKQ